MFLCRPIILHTIDTKKPRHASAETWHAEVFREARTRSQSSDPASNPVDELVLVVCGQPKTPYIDRRVKLLHGKTKAQALTTMYSTMLEPLSCHAATLLFSRCKESWVVSTHIEMH